MSEQQPENTILNSTINDLCYDSIYNTNLLFQSNYGSKPPDFVDSLKIRLQVKINDEYKQIHNQKKQVQKDNMQNADETDELVKDIRNQAQLNDFKDLSDQMKTQPKQQQQQKQQEQQQAPQSAPQKKSQIEKVIDTLPKETADKVSKIPRQFLNFTSKTQQYDTNKQLMIADAKQELLQQHQDQITHHLDDDSQPPPLVDNKYQLQTIDTARMGNVMVSKIKKIVKPTWHRPWKLMRVISGHKGWVRCIAVDPGNQFFVTGSNDRTIKFWDLASGQLKITLTGHINAVRGLVVSPRHPYLFSAGEDKTVRCWDLEMNQVIRNYHGHLSGVYTVALHPTLNVIATGGRDAVVRIWDIRVRNQIHVLSGHEHTVNNVITSEFEPQIISGSQDTTAKCWDLAAGKCVNTLTNHKKGIRGLRFHPQEYTFYTAAADNIKVWKCPEGRFLRNISGHNSIVNCVACNDDNVMVSGGDDGSLKFWDWSSGYNFQSIHQKPQPGSISAENGIYAMEFDKSSMRLITAECDKTIKIYKEDEEATIESFPITDFKVEYN